jgi:hypothetical protein
MAVMSAEEAIAARSGARSEAPLPAREASLHVLFAQVALAAFALYWLTAVVLHARAGTTHFGADAHLYNRLAVGIVDDRITRFHPLTTAMAMAWMKVLGPLLGPWISAHALLKGMFAAVGAVGVWAAMWAFAAVVPRRQAVLWGAIYAASLGVWYFSSIEESKIVSTTLAVLYIAVYLHLRTDWTLRGALLLTAILLAACMNEVIAGFLVAIPVVDTLVQRGWAAFREGRWILWHALTAPLALLFLEGVVNRGLTGVPVHAEGASHLSMLIFYVTRNELDLPTVYEFLVKWLFFNVAAPSMYANEYPGLPGTTAGDFDPALKDYFASPLSVALVALFGLMLAAALWPRRGGGAHALPAALLLALASFALVRGVFFLVFNPGECMLFSSGTTLVHMLLVAIPFAASRLPAKQGILAAAAALLLIVNGAFMIGPGL